MSDKVECPRCHRYIELAHIDRHARTKDCRVAVLARKLTAQGWARCKNGSRLLRSVGVPVRTELTQVGYGVYQNVPWVPTWAAALVALPFKTKRRKRRALQQAVIDEELRRAAVAALALAGPARGLEVLLAGVPT